MLCYLHSVVGPYGRQGAAFSAEPHGGMAICIVEDLLIFKTFICFLFLFQLHPGQQLPCLVHMTRLPESQTYTLMYTPITLCCPIAVMCLLVQVHEHVHVTHETSHLG